MGKKDKKPNATTATTAAAAPVVKAISMADLKKKLQPIYDLIDARNYKGAIKSLDSLIEKNGKHEIFLALKAVALQRAGKNSEAEELLREVAQLIPTDGATLSTLTIVYQALEKEEEVVKLYENAFKKDPKAEELGLSLFYAYGKIGAYGKQQQVSMQLYSAFKKERYVFWSAVNILLQVVESQRPSSSSSSPSSSPSSSSSSNPAMALLPLASGLIAKHSPADKPMHPEVAMLAVKLLDYQAKYTEAVALLDGPQGSLLSDDILEHRRLKAEMLTKLNRWNDVRDVFKELIAGPGGNPDDWADLQGFIDASLRANENKKEAVEGVLSVLKELQKAELDSPHPRRGPFLAEVELLFLSQPDKDADVSEYFARFGTKPCFFQDVRKYLRKVKDANKFLASLSKQEPEKDMIKLANFCFIARFLATDGGKDQSSADFFHNQYVVSQKLVKSLEPTERGVGDGFLQLAVLKLLDQFEKTQDRGLLMNGIIALEHALQVESKYNFQFKLLLMRLYCHPAIGALKRATEVFGSLEVKNIQVETLGHLIIADSQRLGDYSNSSNLIRHLMSFHEIYHQEDAELPGTAYKKEHYSKVVELAELRSRLKNSYQLAITKEESWHMEIMDAEIKESVKEVLSKHADVSDADTVEELKRLVVNNDFTSVQTFQPQDHETTLTMNRPAEAIFSSTFSPPDHPLQQQPGAETWQLTPFQERYLRFKRALPRLFKAMWELNADKIRKETDLVAELLEKMGAFTDKSVQAQWKLCLDICEAVFLTASLEQIASSACSVEEASSQFESDRFKEIKTVVERIVKSIEGQSSTVTELYAKPATAAHVDAEAIAETSTFLMYGCQFLLVALQVWGGLPKPGGKKGARKAKAGDKRALPSYTTQIGEVFGGASAIQQAFTSLLASRTKAATQLKLSKETLSAYSSENLASSRSLSDKGEEKEETDNKDKDKKDQDKDKDKDSSKTKDQKQLQVVLRAKAAVAKLIAGQPLTKDHLAHKPVLPIEVDEHFVAEVYHYVEASKRLSLVEMDRAFGKLSAAVAAVPSLTP